MSSATTATLSTPSTTPSATSPILPSVRPSPTPLVTSPPQPSRHEKKSRQQQLKKLERSLQKFVHQPNNSTILRRSLIPFLRINDLETYLQEKNFIPLMLSWWNQLLTNKFNNKRNELLECISRLLPLDLNDNIMLERTYQFCLSLLNNSKNLTTSHSAFIGKVFAYCFYKSKNQEILTFLTSKNCKVLSSFIYHFVMIIKKHNSNGQDLVFIRNKIYHTLRKSILMTINPPPIRPPQPPPPSQQQQQQQQQSQSQPTQSSQPPVQPAQSAQQPPPIPQPVLNQQSPHTGIFRVVRSIIFRAKTNDPITGSIVKTVDDCLISIAKETSIHDVNRNGILMNIVGEFINHIHIHRCSPNEEDDEALAHPEDRFINVIDWEFWLSCNYMMIHHCDHVQILLKSFTFLFNTWEMIPDSLCLNKKPGEPYKWITNLQDSIKSNFVNFCLASDENFVRFLTHWNPLVRSYYIKLLVWRIIGINNYQSSIKIQMTGNIQMKLFHAFKFLENFTILYNGNLDLNYKPDNPLVNRKFGIIPITIRDDYLSIDETRSNSDLSLPATLNSSQLRKTHPYEVLDDAVYTCSSSVPISEVRSSPTTPKKGSRLSPSPTRSSSTSSISTTTNSSLMSSLGKLFKILSTDDNNKLKLNDIQEDEDCPPSSCPPPKMKRNSVSLTSLSTAYSFKSRSSSPSIMSYKSTPTESSSVSTDSDSIQSSDTINSGSTNTVNNATNGKTNAYYNVQPPELSQLPPEIIRPIYKFDIIVCHESLNSKFSMIHHKNAIINQRRIMNHNNNSDGSYNSPKYHPTTSYFPLVPEIPVISIFVGSDSYNNNRIYINEEDSSFLSLNPAQEPKSELSFKDLNLVQVLNLGKSINEFNLVVDEFKRFLNNRVEIDSINQGMMISSESVYFKKIIPFLSVDSSNEMKWLNGN
ncbi:hypothetical protein Cantr_00035 [Candida viswanathii]|uniref:DUF1765-domain-containing protein n=1 Tax=Candida viswanathii TaxID=5486 RepID=A0A367YEV2_9ASCO|nr:hypothetical protein Cantr_00035 [Candida viswanathii]